jgi:5'-nucleotidase
MKILVSNDDGYLATGINALIDALEKVADVTVVAPDRNRSAASNSLTLSRPLRVSEYGKNRYKVDGTPSDCVHLAVTGLLDEEPDLVVSGINHGANLGDDTIYSGTVAAAMEGRFLGLPTIAVSLVGRTLVGAKLTHFETAARVAVELVEKIERASLASDTVLNVNVPDLPYEELQGIRATRLGFRHKSEKVLQDLDPYGRRIYWVGPAGEGQDTGEDTDFHAISQGAASVTPLKVDLTRYEAVDGLAAWLEQ